MKIKVKQIVKGTKFNIIDKGDWIDLCAAEDVELSPPQGIKYESDGSVKIDVSVNYTLVRLGIAMALPRGYEAIIAPRSSTFKQFNVIQSNSFGVIDYSYRSSTDEWKLPVIALGRSTIKKGNRICQFRIQLSQKATIWQRIKWLFTSKIEFIWVDRLDSESRGGFGSTGK